MRTLVANQITAQQSGKRTPYFLLSFTSKTGSTVYNFNTDSPEYPNRILMIDHTEEPYNDYAYIMLRNNDRAVPDLVGYHVYIGYGDTYSGVNYAEQVGNLWVKEQRLVSAPGKLYTLLVLEGTWSLFREQMIFLGSPPYFDGMDRDTEELVDEITNAPTIYDMIGLIIDKVNEATGLTLTLYALGSADDGIIDSYVPGEEYTTFKDNGLVTASDIIQQLMAFTKCYLRIEYNSYLRVIFPQIADAVNKTYYSNQVPYFKEATSNDPLLVPNSIVVYCAANPDGTWRTPAEVAAEAGIALDQDSIDQYMVVKKINISAYVPDKAQADDRADAILTKTKAQLVYGQITMPHDAAVEIYDYIEAIDNRGAV
jgi:hypothetical protein